MPRPPIRRILCDGDPWHALGRWGPATVQYTADEAGRNVFHGITPLAWWVITVAVRWSDLWLSLYKRWEALEQRETTRAQRHRAQARIAVEE